MIPDGDSPLPNTEVHRLGSEHVGDDFKVLIGHAGTEPEGPRPVLVMADPWAGFGTAVVASAAMRPHSAKNSAEPRGYFTRSMAVPVLR